MVSPVLAAAVGASVVVAASTAPATPRAWPAGPLAAVVITLKTGIELPPEPPEVLEATWVIATISLLTDSGEPCDTVRK